MKNFFWIDLVYCIDQYAGAPAYVCMDTYIIKNIIKKSFCNVNGMNGEIVNL